MMQRQEKTTMKIVVLTNILNPYATARLSTLGAVKNIELTVMVQTSNEANRTWQLDDFAGNSFETILLPGIHLRIGIADRTYLHLNYGVKKNLKRINPDAVVILGWNNPTTFIAARACKKLKIPVIAWSGSTKNEPSLLRSLGKPVIRRFHRQCAAFVSYGSAAKSLLVDYWGIDPAKIFILGNPVDNTFFINESKKSKKNKSIYYNGAKNKYSILFIGQIIQRKGLLELVRAFRILQKKIRNVDLIIAGKGPYEKKLKEIISDEGIENIHFIGYCNQDKLPALYSQSTIFCLPSREEVWGLVINEAMACGIPVIASEVCGAVEDLIIHNTTGMVFHTGDQNDLSEKMETLLRDSALRRAISRKGKEHIQKWDIAKLVARMQKAVQFAIENSGKH